MQIANSLPRKLNTVAESIPYDNTNSSIKSTNIQDAIDELDNENNALHDCSTARNTIAKVVAYDGFVLKKGARIYVRFTDTGTANPTSGNITLNVNNTGAKTIVDGKSNKTVLTYAYCSWFCNNSVHEFIYDGTYWVWMTRDANTTYTGATLKTGDAKTGSGTTVTDTIAKSTTIDNAIGTLLNNDYALNSSLTEAKTDIDTLNSNLTKTNQSLSSKVDTTDSRLSDARTPKAHTHDDRYYTESEINTQLNALVKNHICIGVKTESITVNGNSDREYSFPFSLPSGAKIIAQLPIIYASGKGISIGRNVNKDFAVLLWNNNSSTVNVGVSYYVVYAI